MDKKLIAAILKETSICLELKGENPFKSRAYSNAVRIIENLDVDLEQLIKENNLEQINGIGKGMAEKIKEIALTGESKYHKELRAALPEGLFNILEIQGLGPKKVKILYEKLDITTVGELEYACLENRLLDLQGFGKKSQLNILAGIENLKKYQSRFLYPVALENAQKIVEYLSSYPETKSIEIAGSLRRKMETVKDIDILVCSDQPEGLSRIFLEYPQIESITAQGETKISVKLETGINVDLRIVAESQYPCALHHFTGSKDHNTAMRSRAKKKGFKINEYGLFRNDSLITCADECELFQNLDLCYIPPELRENLGEISAAEQNLIPELVKKEDIQGIFHIHTTASDGSNSLSEIVDAAKKMGWKYIGISDHSQTASYAGGLKEDQIKVQHEEIDKINAFYNPDFHVFKGIESDILPDGNLDYPDKILESFDFIIASVHSSFRLSREVMTNRILNAMKHPCTTMLGHPTGRLLLSREPYELDMDKILETAAELNIIIEINSHPHRLDLDWREVRKARELDIMISINPDAHHVDGFNDYLYGIGIARKGWLSKQNIINCMNLADAVNILNRSNKV